jgi:hypothetical protein
MSPTRSGFRKLASAISLTVRIIIATSVVLVALAVFIAPTVGMLYLMYCAALWGPQ